MLEENSGSMPQENQGQDVQPDASVDTQDYKESFNQEKAYSQKLRSRAQSAESELEKLKARNKKMEEDSLIEQNKYKELWEKDKTDAQWARMQAAVGNILGIGAQSSDLTTNELSTRWKNDIISAVKGYEQENASLSDF